MMRKDYRGCLSRHLRDICLLVLLGVIVSLANPSSAGGDYRQFIPKIFDYTGELSLEFHRERIENTANGIGLKTTDTLFSEKITLMADGYSYDPRFVLFHLKLAGDLEEEWFKSSSTGNDSRIKFLPEYELRALILAEHPYNLELYAQRYSPFIRAQLTVSPNPVVENYGAIFRYRKKPVFAFLQFDDTSYSTDDDTRDSKTYSAQVTYLMKRFINAARYSHKDSTASRGDQTIKGDFLTYDHRLVIGSAKFSGDGSYAVASQKSPFLPTLDTSRVNYTESLTVPLPLNVESSLYYTYSKDITKSGETADSPRIRDFYESNSGGLNLTHRLYRSLVTSFNYNATGSKSTGGDQTSSMYSLTSTYSKMMFFGTMALSGYYSRADLERHGTVIVLNEVHNAKLFGEFNLNQQNIDQTTIIIRVVSPATGVLVELTRGIHYTLFLVGNTVMVRIISLPVEVLNPDPLFIYEFRVSYSPLSGDFVLETPSYGYSIRLGFFNNAVNPYFSYDRTNQKVVSGIFPGIPEDSKRITIGISAAKGPYSLLAEYQNTSSVVNPSKRFISQLGYMKEVLRGLNLSAHVRYEHRKEVITDITNINSGLASIIPGGERPTDIYGGDLGITKTFTSTNLTFNVVAAYMVSKDPEVKTDSYSINSYLNWVAGYLNVQGGTEISRVKSNSSVGEQRDLRDYYYLIIKRQLF